MLTDRILRSALIAISTWLAGTQLAAAGIIPNPNPYVTPTPPPRPNPAVLLTADPQLARAVVRYGENATLSLANDRGRFQKVALQPDEVVTVLVTLSPADYGKPAAVELLDGGAMTTSVPKPNDILPTPYPTPTLAAIPINSAPNATPTIPPAPSVSPSTLVDTGALMTVSQVGELAFAFKPGADAGRHRISIIVGGNQYFLQFWRQDSSAPNNNPRMLRAY
jgi:hypothetical protein